MAMRRDGAGALHHRPPQHPGGVLWLGAQLFGAYRHRVWDSPLARLVFTRVPGLRVLNPQRRRRRCSKPDRRESVDR
ncbi:hypothetical protein [Rhodococcus koreensis]|uniref:hypothetical protein n=1 Tax=Rhodococcus koreensis TaxID=99653 RepID=UPI001160013F|nr:hypothetical protein [Rhodococcus koreensis]